MATASLPTLKPKDYLHLLDQAAAKFRRRDRNFEELKNAGFPGLAKACETFDPSKGPRFEPWAILNIRYAIQDHLRETEHMIRIPGNEAASLKKPPAENLSAAALARRAAAARVLHARTIGDHSLERGSLADLIEARPDNNRGTDAVKEIEFLLKVLPETQRRAVEMYHGLGGSGEMSFDNIATAMGVSREKVRRDYYKGTEAMKQAANGEQFSRIPPQPSRNGTHNHADAKRKKKRECPTCHHPYGKVARCYQRDCPSCSVRPKSPPASQPKKTKGKAVAHKPAPRPLANASTFTVPAPGPTTSALRELETMKQITVALAALPRDAAARVLAWTAVHFDMEVA